MNSAARQGWPTMVPPPLPPPPVSTRHLETRGDGYPLVLTCVSSEIRASLPSSQAEGRRFESGIPLHTYGASGSVSALCSHRYSHLRGSKSVRGGSAWAKDGMW